MINAPAFNKMYQDFLAQYEKQPAQADYDELQSRIAKGEEKVAAALARDPDALYKVAGAQKKLDELRNEALKIKFKWLDPHLAYAHIAAMIQAVGGMEFGDEATIKVDIPGILRVDIEVSSEPPF